ncbi:MAG TPA: 1-acyl-sn-glycerol-3-phosphate acyltransferase, partial [Burkholderiaceae bacterium]|nr:1-acyl-sn-glycerol-3-phosphate acyltransferase [Burkholderiaceae bacterium]
MLLTQRPVQLHGSRLARALLRLAGWRVLFDGLPAAQGVAIVYPHTSNWDFVVGLLAKWSIGIPVNFWGKDSLFRIPLFGRWVRWVGGVPVDRTHASGVVGSMAASLREAREQGRFQWLALAPEGTRRYV